MQQNKAVNKEEIMIFGIGAKITLIGFQSIFEMLRGTNMKSRRFSDDGFVYDDNDDYVSSLDDDHEYWKSEQEALTNPLSDDYCKYDNE